MNGVDIQALNLSTDICVRKKKKKSRASLQCNASKSSKKNQQRDSNLHPDLTHTADYKDQENICVQVRCHSSSQQREVPTHSSFELCEFTRRKKSALISVRIHIQTRLLRYFGGGSFIIVVMGLFWFFFFLI